MFVTYLSQLAADPGPTAFDTELLDLADRIRNDMLVDVAKVVTSLGAFPTVATLVVATAVLLVARKRYAEALMLVLGLALVFIAVNVTKDALDRARPRRLARRARPERRIRVATRHMRRRGWRWPWCSRAGCGW